MYDRKEEMTDSTQLLNGEKSINYFVKNAQFIYLEFKQHNMKQIGRCVLFKFRHLIYFFVVFVNEIFQHNHLLPSKLFPPRFNALVRRCLSLQRFHSFRLCLSLQWFHSFRRSFPKRRAVVFGD